MTCCVPTHQFLRRNGPGIESSVNLGSYREDSSAKNPNQPNEDQVNRYDIVQDSRHDRDQDSGNQGKERSGQGVMNRHSSATGLRQQGQRDDQEQRPKQSKPSVEHSAPRLRKSTHSLHADACRFEQLHWRTVAQSLCGPADVAGGAKVRNLIDGVAKMDLISGTAASSVAYAKNYQADRTSAIFGRSCDS